MNSDAGTEDFFWREMEVDEERRFEEKLKEQEETTRKFKEKLMKEQWKKDRRRGK
jgi:hypothetical protein